jgi:hypothetical protein
MTRVLGHVVKVADIFKYSTISQLLKHNHEEVETAIPKGDLVRTVLSFAQERLWFIEQYEEGSNAYH